MNQTSAHVTPPIRSFYCTYLLLGINIILYFIMHSKGGPTYENLVLFGAKENGLIALGEYGRLFFPMFLHASMAHLLFNMYALYQVGRYLELVSGPRTLIKVYIVAGITGNVFSFAISPALSVGASSSLFGILLCIFVLKKYEEKLAESMNETIPKSGLGVLILLNALISFVIPNIDWASHLGGAVAGTLLGLALIMKHRFQMRSFEAARYLGRLSQLPQPKLIERDTLYLGLTVLINICFLASVTRVTWEQKALGLGIKKAAQDNTESRDATYLSQFKPVLSSRNSETEPNHLFLAAVALQNAEKYETALQIFDVLEIFYEHQIGNQEFLSASTGQLLQLSKDAAESRMTAPTEVSAGLGADQITLEAQLCEKPASLLATLGFFQLSGKLFECAFLLDQSRLELAAETVRSYWKASNQRDVYRFLTKMEEAKPRIKAPVSDPI